MRRAIIFGNFRKDRIANAIASVRPWLEERLVVAVHDSSCPTSATPSDADLAVVFGGDGAMLHAARALGQHQIPIAGVNMGKLGFLAEVPYGEVRPALAQILSGDCQILRRMLLHCRATRGGAELVDSLALNDAVISRSTLSRLVSIDLVIDNVGVTTYNADGLIISTPVGSTAHSLSAGGPIVNPGLDALIVTPICPHTLTNRPIVEPAESCIEMVVRSKAESIGLTIDGQVYVELECGDRVSVRRASQCLHLISIGAREFHETLRDKLHWGGHPRYAEGQDTT